MKKLLPLLLLLLSGMAKAQIVNIPDPQFKAYLLSASFTNSIAINSSFIASKIDTNNDGEIQVAEAADIVRLWIEDIQITNVEGLEAFTGLEEVTIKGTNLMSFGLDMPTLPKLQITQNPLLQSVVVSGMPNLNQLDCNFNPILISVNAANCDLLTTASLNDNSLTTLNLSNHPGLVNLYCQNNQLTSLNVSNCINIQGISAGNNQLTSMHVSGLTNLGSIDITGNPGMTQLDAAGCSALFNLLFDNGTSFVTMDLGGCANLTAISVYDMPNLTSLNLSGCTSLINAMISNNPLTDFDITECTALQYLICVFTEINSLDLTGCTDLIEITAYHNQLTSININDSANLETLTLHENMFTALNIPGHTQLVYVNLTGNPIANLNLSGCTALTGIDFPPNELAYWEDVNFSGCTSLLNVHLISDQLQQLDVQGCTALTGISIGGTSENHAPITSLDVTNLPSLYTINCYYTNLDEIIRDYAPAMTHVSLFSCNMSDFDFSAWPNLSHVTFNSPTIQTIDLSGLHELISLDLSGSVQLKHVYAKNGSHEGIGLSGCSQLEFICQDDDYIDVTTQHVSNAGLSNVNINSYCSMPPGGDFNTITGTVRFDSDSNGCDAADAVQPDIRININDGNEQGATFSAEDGSYKFYSGAGAFALTLGIENPALYTITPSPAIVTFPNQDNNTITRNFCVTANAPQNDVEIVIAPITPARPGFSSLYQIVIKNKGNQTLDGSFNFAFDDTLMDFVVATTVVSSQSAGMLNWNYTDLLPFENRSVYVLLNVNSPTQTPAVNQDDVLSFIATINPIVNDINATDNQFIYNQTVVGSFDPNDITCMEGENVSPQDIGKYLHYVINFENTGTYQAEQVVVKIVVDDTKYDISSLQLLNTSHTVRPVIKGNTAEFFFEGINLAAAEGNPPVGGHGNILFKIRTLPSLVTGDEVISKADIFFDYNTPIGTNEARTLFQTLSAPGAVKDQSIVLYPNPAKNFVTIQCDNIIRSVDVYDIRGRILGILKRESNTVTVDISNRANGIYFVKVITDKGMQVQKIVKE